MFITRTTRKSVEEIRLDFRPALRRFGLVYVGVHNMKDHLLRNGHYIKGEFMVFEFSNPPMVRAALKFNPQVLCLSPGRIAVYSDGGATRLSAIAGVPITRSLKLPKKIRGPALDTSRRYERVMSSLFDVLCSRRKNGPNDAEPV